MKFDALGRELPDPTPVELPFGAQRPESLQDMIRRLVRTDVSRAAEQAGAETFEEANDFEVEEDDAESSLTHHEVLGEEVIGEALRMRQEVRDAQLKKRNAPEPEDEGADEDEPEPPKKRAGSVKKKAPRREPEGEEEE